MTTAAPRVEVTLSAELLRHLRDEAGKLGVAIEWLIASLIVDTLDGLPAPASATA